MDKMINYEKIISEVEKKNISAFYEYGDVLDSMKEAIRQSIPIILEEAARNAKVKISMYTENGKVWTVNKESILDLEDQLKKDFNV